MEERKRRRLTAKRKFEIYLETKEEGAKIGEILRREGIHLNDLREIEELVERGATSALKMKGPGRTTRKKIDPIEYDQLKHELQEKEKAMSDLMVECSLLKKSDCLASRARLMESNLRTLESDKCSWKQLKKHIKKD
jgi:transposase-like protein